MMGWLNHHLAVMSASTSLSPRYWNLRSKLVRTSFAPAFIRPAFSLVEVTMVLLLAGLLASMVALSLAGPAQVMRLEDALDRIAQCDRRARLYARRFGRPLQLTFRLDSGEISATSSSLDESADDARFTQDQTELTLRTDLPDRFHLVRLLVADQKIEAGQVSLPCSSNGQTPSYALGLTSPRDAQQWVVVAGLTGQVTRVKDEAEAQGVLSQLSEF